MKAIIEQLYFLLFTLCFSFPKMFIYLKTPILLALLLLSLTSFLKDGNFKLRKNYLIFFIGWIFLSLTWVAWSVVQSNEFSAIMDYLRIYVLFFIIYFFVFVLSMRVSIIGVVLKSVCWSSIIIAMTNVILVIVAWSGFNFLPDWFLDGVNFKVGIHDSYIQMGVNNITSLFFVAPIILIMACAKVQWKANNRKLVFFSLFAVTLAVALSSRRALYLIFVLSPLLFIFMEIVFFKRFKFGLVNRVGAVFLSLAVLILVMIAIGDVDYNSSFNRISSAFVLDEDSVRVRQFNALMAGFFETPLMGSGLGGFVDDGRVKETPWSYELFYIAALYKGGIIGFSLISILMSWIFIKAGFNCKALFEYRLEALAILTGIFAFCLASFTNPYFSGFDALLILALLPVLASIRDVHTGNYLLKSSNSSEAPLATLHES